jgi:acyl dehydratase
MRIINGIDELKIVVGEHLGYSDWVEVTQERVNQFAEATGDHQWIHVDISRAMDEGPFGGTIAHGYLTLSLIPTLVRQVYRIDRLKMIVNYGANKVRFPSPVPVGSRVRAGVEILSAETKGESTQLISRITIEREGSDKPVCVAETVAVAFI